MKFSLAFLVVLALSGAVNIRASPVRHSDELHKVLEEFLALVPQDKVVEIFLDYLENDDEVQTVVEYVQTDSFKELVRKVESIEDVMNFYNYLQESGLDVYGLVNQMHDVIGLPPLVPGGYARKARRTGGVSGLIADIKAVLPIEDIKALYHEKLETSAAFAQLVERLSSPRFQELIDALRVNKEFQRIVAFAKKAGVDVNHIKDLLTTVLGLQFPSRHIRRLARNNLHDDLDDFLALLPIDDITEIALDYLENDAQVQEAITYMQSDAFHTAVQEVEAMQEARDVLAFLEESGLSAYDFLNSVHELLGIPAFKPTFRHMRSLSRATGGINGLIADVKAILPIDDIKALYYQKLENSLAFNNLIKRLSSPQFQEFVDAVLIKDEVRVILNKLKEHQVDLQAIADLVSTILGLHFPKPSVARASHLARDNLQDDLDDFLALLPIDDITEIALDYLENDAQVEEAITYMQGEAFHTAVQEVEAMQEARDVLAFLEESGLPAYDFLNMLHEFFGIPEFKPTYRHSRTLSRATGGINGLIADIKAILPIDEIKALYYQKLENSLAFSNLIKRLSSPQFQEFVDAVLAKDEARVIIKKLKDHQVDLQAIADLVSTILGLHFPKPTVARVSNELMKDLEEFMDLLPTEEMTDIAVDYVLNDAAVQSAAVYVKSAEFRKLAAAAQQNGEFRGFIGYLDASGLPASDFMNNINSILGLPQVNRRTLRAGGGVRGMIDAIEATLPREEIKALYEHKKKSSKAFSHLIQRLEAAEFQAIVDALALNKDFQNLGYQAASYGIDLDVIVDFMKRIFGIEIRDHRLSRAARSLEDDLKEFVALIPAKKIRGIVGRYILTDKEVKAAVVYVRSEEFAKLVGDLNDIPEYHDLLESLEASGLDVQGYVEKVHKVLGIASVPYFQFARKTNGIAGMIEEIKATLPVDDIKALYKHKLETSEEFAGLVELISSNKFQAVTDALFANETFQDILHRLQSHGINLQVVADFFLKIFGITTPPGVIDFRFRL